MLKEEGPWDPMGLLAARTQKGAQSIEQYSELFEDIRLLVNLVQQEGITDRAFMRRLAERIEGRMKDHGR